MDTYNSFISQFEIFDNPPLKKGYERHHIVPQEEQRKIYGKVIDQRQVYITPAQHLWLHILYDKENGTFTRRLLLSRSGLRIKDIHCYEDCLPFNDKDHPAKGHKHTEEWKKQQSERWTGSNNPNYGGLSEEHKYHVSISKQGTLLSEEHKIKISNSLKGMTSNTKGHKWFNNGIKSIMAFECPEGFVPGRIYHKINNLS